MECDVLFQVFRKDWAWQPLGEVCHRGGGDIQTGPFGSQLHAADYVPFGVPSIMPQNISQDRVNTEGIARITPTDAERLSRYLLKPGDIVYSRRGDVERRALITEQENGWLCGTGCLRIRFGDGVVIPQFASYFLSHPASREWVVRHAVGATMPNLNTSILSALPFLLPPLHEQRAIAEVLGVLDDKIESNHKTSQALERIARAIFRAWFVDFEPVKAKAIGALSFPGMPRKAFDALPARLIESELGPVPEGWGVKAAYEVADVEIGKTPPRKEHHWFSQNIKDIRWISIRDLAVDEAFISHTAEFLTVEAVQQFRIRVIPDDTVVLSFKLTMGRVAITDGEMLSNEAIAHFRLKPETVFGSAYLYCYLKAFSYDKLGSTSSIATAINSDMVRRIPILVPPEPIAKDSEQILKPLFKRMRTLQRECAKLATLRDYLLPKLLSGEVHVEARHA